jgi:predicted secreted hydrolase
VKICELMKAANRSVLAAVLVAIFSGMSWQVAEPGFQWSFPRDHWPHPGYATEWWYFTGHLEDVDDPQRRFGYQFTVFRIGLVPPGEEAGSGPSGWQTSQLFMGHAAIGDLSLQEHHFSDLLYREMPLLAGFGAPEDPLIAWSRGPAGTEEKWTLRWNGEGFDLEMHDRGRGMSLQLSTRPQRPLVFQGPDGLSPKGKREEAASHYYSFTRLETQGRLTLGETSRQVRGTSWMDREFASSQLSSGQVGWDWMGLQLDDGRDLMLYLLRAADGSIDFSSATLLTTAGEVRYLQQEEWTLSVLSRRESEMTGAEYPSRWRLAVPAENLAVEIVPVFLDQENVAERSANLHYWEGAVHVQDDRQRRVGRGYVELTGYGEGNRPPI